MADLELIRRRRAPRLHMRWARDIGGLPYWGDLPLVVGVMGDFVGHATGSIVPLEAREFLETDRDNIDERMRKWNVGLDLVVPDKLTGVGELPVHIEFRSMADFSPARIIQQVPRLRESWNAMTALRSQGHGKHDPDPNRRAKSVEPVFLQVAAILHHPDFQRLEGSWRGLHYLVNNTETNEALKIRVLSVTKLELGEALEKAKGTASSQSPIYKMLHGDERSRFEWEPFGCIVGDYSFGRHPESIAMLGEMAKIASTAHSPFITGVSAGFFEWENYSDLPEVWSRAVSASRMAGGVVKPGLANLVKNVAYAQWRAFRSKEESKYVVLTLPRTLARPPSAEAGDLSQEPDSNGGVVADPQEVGVCDSSQPCWMNSAYVLGTRIAEVFARTGWVTELEGTPDGLPLLPVPYDLPPGGVPSLVACSTEVAVTEPSARDFVKMGFAPLSYRDQDGCVSWGNVPTCHKATQHDCPDEMIDAVISARLPCVLALSRIAHHLERLWLESPGNCLDGASRESWQPKNIEKRLNEWIAGYCLSDAQPTRQLEIAHPLLDARIEVLTSDQRANALEVMAWLRPRLPKGSLSKPVQIRVRLS